jgi:uncharacterized protein
MSNGTEVSKVKKQRHLRPLLLVVGTICLVLGAIGIFLPILPTTPFLLLAAACYVRSSDRMHKWLLGNRWLGEYIKNYQSGKGIPMKTKIIALAVLWTGMMFSAFFVVNEVLIAQIALVIIGIGVSVHLIKLPTFKKQL